jgi:hypothetical protein
MMATPRERAALLAVPCPWCGAGPQSECVVRGLRNRRRGERGPSSLDGHCHDARWQAALGRPAPVLVHRLDVLMRRGDDEDEPERGSVAVLDPPRSEGERPW